jgi:T-complex protein 1 subunit eta
VGDGTTSVVLIAGEILKQAKPFVEEGVHPQVIMRWIRFAGKKAVAKIQDISVPFEINLDENPAENEMLLKCASTALNSKLIATHQDLFAPMVVQAITSLDQYDADLELVAVKKIPGGDVRQSFLVKGVAFKKTFSYAGFEQMVKKFTNPKVLLLNVELELKSEKENAEVRIESPEQYQSIVDAEWQVIYDKLDACVAIGANIVLSKLPVGDLATQYFADRGLFCAGRVDDGDMKRVSKATGAVIQTTTTNMTSASNESILGTCGLFEERQMGDERFNVFEGCSTCQTVTIILRGGTEQFIAESHRSIHDALMVVKRSMTTKAVVAGGGAVEMEVSKYLKEESLKIEGKGQLIVAGMAKALEVIPRQLAENAGLDSTDILSALRKKHIADGDDDVNAKWFGVNISDKGGICNTFESGVWEPSSNKMNSIAAAVEACCVILSIDETVRNPKSNAPDSGMMENPGQKPLSNMMGNAMDIANAQKGGSRSGNLGKGVSYMKGRGGG